MRKFTKVVKDVEELAKELSDTYLGNSLNELLSEMERVLTENGGVEEYNTLHGEYKLLENEYKRVENLSNKLKNDFDRKDKEYGDLLNKTKRAKEEYQANIEKLKKATESLNISEEKTKLLEEAIKKKTQEHNDNRAKELEKQEKEDKDKREELRQLDEVIEYSKNEKKELDKKKEEAKEELKDIQEQGRQAQEQIANDKKQAQEQIANDKKQAGEEIANDKREATEWIESEKAKAQTEIENDKKQAQEQIANDKREAQEQIASEKAEWGDAKKTLQEQLEELENKVREREKAHKDLNEEIDRLIDECKDKITNEKEEWENKKLSLQEELDKLEGKQTTLQEDINKLSSDKSQLEGTLTTLRTSISEQESNLETISNQLTITENTLEEKKAEVNENEGKLTELKTQITNSQNQSKELENELETFKTKQKEEIELLKLKHEGKLEGMEDVMKDELARKQAKADEDFYLRYGEQQKENQERMNKIKELNIELEELIREKEESTGKKAEELELVTALISLESKIEGISELDLKSESESELSENSKEFLETVLSDIKSAAEEGKVNLDKSKKGISSLINTYNRLGENSNTLLEDYDRLGKVVNEVVSPLRDVPRIVGSIDQEVKRVAYPFALRLISDEQRAVTTTLKEVGLAMGIEPTKALEIADSNSASLQKGLNEICKGIGYNVRDYKEIAEIVDNKTNYGQLDLPIILPKDQEELKLGIDGLHRKTNQIPFMKVPVYEGSNVYTVGIDELLAENMDINEIPFDAVLENVTLTKSWARDKGYLLDFEYSGDIAGTYLIEAYHKAVAQVFKPFVSSTMDKTSMESEGVQLVNYSPEIFNLTDRDLELLSGGGIEGKLEGFIEEVEKLDLGWRNSLEYGIELVTQFPTKHHIHDFTIALKNKEEVIELELTEIESMNGMEGIKDGSFIAGFLEKYRKAHSSGEVVKKENTSYDGDSLWKIVSHPNILFNFGYVKA